MSENLINIKKNGKSGEKLCYIDNNLIIFKKLIIKLLWLFIYLYKDVYKKEDYETFTLFAFNVNAI